jgi:hypothetical protein
VIHTLAKHALIERKMNAVASVSTTASSKKYYLIDFINATKWAPGELQKFLICTTRFQERSVIKKHTTINLQFYEPAAK